MSEKYCVNVDGITNPIDALFDAYFDSRGRGNIRVEEAYERFCHTLVDVDPFLIEEIIGAATELCMEHERTGFFGGIRTGVRFANEMNK